MRLAGKIAIITGTAGGMGQASALLFAREGAKVACVDLTDDANAETMALLAAAGATAISIAADVTRTADVERIVARTVAELGLPTILFNNAGADTENKQSILDIEEAAFDRVVEVNLKGPWLMIKHVAPKMIEGGGGSIINTASIGAFIAASSAGYCASKAGLVGLTKVAAVELARHHIRVNTLCPGATETPMAKHQREEMEKAGLPTNAIIDRMGLMGRMARPEEMAYMALFLASDESSFATGADFINDAGWLAMSGVPTASSKPRQILRPEIL
jgi:NAD(P)-dependent dehydrogenase (short-subunit alcohol dehydrogenase family)